MEIGIKCSNCRRNYAYCISFCYDEYSWNIRSNIYCGRSLVVDPYGKILLDMKKRQGIGYVKISTKQVTETRKLLPLLKNRRTDIYSNFKI